MICNTNGWKSVGYYIDVLPTNTFWIASWIIFSVSVSIDEVDSYTAKVLWSDTFNTAKLQLDDITHFALQNKAKWVIMYIGGVTNANLYVNDR